jgi:transglutaminase-like putative cysteine protease
MRVRVSCHATHAFEPPARLVTQILRLTPRNQESQRIYNWRIDVDVDCALRASEDAFGNVTHVFNAPGPLDQVTVSVDGEVETFDIAGVARDAIERFPPELYLRSTGLTLADDALRRLASDIAATEETGLGRMHALMDAIGERVKPDADMAASSAAEAFALGRGVVGDVAHAFIACARAMDIPARCVSGFHFAAEDEGDSDALHAWAEAYVETLGWVAFDPVFGICPREGHLCLARGLDYLGAAPVRGARSGGEQMFSVALRSTRVEGFSRY